MSRLIFLLPLFLSLPSLALHQGSICKSIFGDHMSDQDSYAHDVRVIKSIITLDGYVPQIVEQQILALAAHQGIVVDNVYDALRSFQENQVQHVSILILSTGRRYHRVIASIGDTTVSAIFYPRTTLPIAFASDGDCVEVRSEK